MPDFPHFELPKNGQSEDYTSTNMGGGGFKSPPRDRVRHANKLIQQIHSIKNNAAKELAKLPASSNLHIIPVVFQGSDDCELDINKLESKMSGIRVLNVKQEGNHQVATVAIPKGKTGHFEKRIEQYSTENKKSGAPRNEELVSGIHEIRLAALEDYYTDSDGSPPAVDEVIWWETWLDTTADADAVEKFRSQSGLQSIQLSENTVHFPEVAVVLARSSLDDWATFPGLLDFLAEMRRAVIVPSEFLTLDPKDQYEFASDLHSRTQHASENAPAVCLLDTGVNRGHVLLKDSLSADDLHAWHPEWDGADKQGHGTELAGLALYGPLEKPLIESENIVLEHRLESVKILPDKGENFPPDYGPITTGSMEKVERQAPHRSRVFCLAITASDDDEGLPTLWSAQIDQAASGVHDDQKRLTIISAGNISSDVGKKYPDNNHLASVQNPAQSWNGLTVGACTSKVWFKDDFLAGYSPLAPKGRLCPSSTTSMSWEAQEWPIKPELVFEGGNYAVDSNGNVAQPDDLGLLTTRLDDTGTQLGISGDTSGATAQVARMAAILQADYPHFWPETIRGLLVHSANWTPEMKSEFSDALIKARIRCYGWGIPDLTTARECTKNVATIVIEDSLQPFHKSGTKIKTKEMKLHELPFPNQVLQQLGEDEVNMRVTLSYFIEPSPGRKGWGNRHRYASHGLRFDVIRPEEDFSQFRTRLTRTEWDDPKTHPGGTVKDSREWKLKSELRSKGSIHSDWWTGSASSLALCNKIVVYPVTGWWRERPSQEAYDKEARYSLIITISTKKTDIELYAAVKQAVDIQTRISIET